MEKRINKPQNFNSKRHDAGTIHEWLVSRGIPVLGISITNTEIIVDVAEDADVEGAMTTFDPLPSEEETLVPQLEAIDVLNADQHELRAAVDILKKLLVRNQTRIE